MMAGAKYAERQVGCVELHAPDEEVLQYGTDSWSDLFGVQARLELGARLPELPLHSREAIEPATLDFLEIQIHSAEHRLEATMKVRPRSRSSACIPAEADPLLRPHPHQ